jgi:outer membrane scaffolding protein for murein synthesis (MipA/OmpV family)
MITRVTRLAPPGAAWSALGTALSLAFAAPAAAQDEPAILPDPEVLPDTSVFDGDYVIVGAGVMSAPTYDGSDKNRILPAVGATGEIGGIGFSIRGPSLSLDLLRDKPGAKWGLRFGPQIRLRANRHGSIGDPVVARLGRLDTVVEAGFRVGASFDDVLSNADGLSVGVSARWDISGNGGGRVITPSATYLLPVSRAQALGFLVSLHFADDTYADYNYGITPAGAAASGLPAFDAKGGLQDVSLGIATARDLNGDFLDGGFAVGAGVLYSRLYGSAARTPITTIRGDRDQWTFGAGLTYTF